MYEIGAMVFYGGEGVCRVEAVGPLEMSGAMSPPFWIISLMNSGKGSA